MTTSGLWTHSIEVGLLENGRNTRHALTVVGDRDRRWALEVAGNQARRKSDDLDAEVTYTHHKGMRRGPN